MIERKPLLATEWAFDGTTLFREQNTHSPLEPKDVFTVIRPEKDTSRDTSVFKTLGEITTFIDSIALGETGLFTEDASLDDAKEISRHINMFIEAEPDVQKRVIMSIVVDQYIMDICDKKCREDMALAEMVEAYSIIFGLNIGQEEKNWKDAQNMGLFIDIMEQNIGLLENGKSRSELDQLVVDIKTACKHDGITDQDAIGYGLLKLRTNDCESIDEQDVLRNPITYLGRILHHTRQPEEYKLEHVKDCVHDRVDDDQIDSLVLDQGPLFKTKVRTVDMIQSGIDAINDAMPELWQNQKIQANAQTNITLLNIFDQVYLIDGDRISRAIKSN